MLVRCCCAGGGGGGANGGGGGAGGFIFRPSFPVTPGATFAVVVGAGGAGSGPAVGTFAPPTPGGNSSFGSDPALVAIGGGAGAGVNTPLISLSGGSGGGGAGTGTGVPGVGLAAGSGTPGQGERDMRTASGGIVTLLSRARHRVCRCAGICILPQEGEPLSPWCTLHFHEGTPACVSSSKLVSSHMTHTLVRSIYWRAGSATWENIIRGRGWRAYPPRRRRQVAQA
jgi:hypothetical protein